MSDISLAMGQYQHILSDVNAQQSTDENLRRHGRVRCLDIMCSLGEVLDISASGAKLSIVGRPPSVTSIIVITIDGLDGPVNFEGQVVWTRRRGLFKFEAGLEWKNLTPVMQHTLVRLARAASQNESVRKVA